jgi:uncharacterized membrane protein
LAGIISVFGIAFIYFWAAIPAGLAQGMSPLMVAAVAAISYASGALVVVIAGQPVRDWLMKRFGGQSAINPNSRIRRIWDRYGLIGLALVAPVTTGAQVGALIGLALNAPPRRLLLLLILGGVIWAVVLTAVFALGIAAVGR